MRSTTVLAVLALAATTAVGAEMPVVGQRAPELTLPAASGGTRSLAELAGKRNLVLVFFRGVW